MKHSFEIYLELYKRKQYDKIPVFKDSTGFYYLSQPQIKALEYLNDNTTRFVGYGGSGMSGKSQLMCFWLLFQCEAFSDVRYLLGRKELSNLKATTFQTLLKTLRFYGHVKGVDYEYNDQKHVLEFNNKSQIILKDTAYYPSDPEMTDLGGLEITGAVLDESAENNIKVINILTTRVNRWNNNIYNLHPKILEAFNPFKNHVCDRYWIPFKKNTETIDTKFVRATVNDNPHPSAKAWAENVLATGDKRTIERLYYGNFDYDDSDNALLTYDKITDLFTNTFVKKTGELSMTCDIALSNDAFCCIVWDGWVIIDLILINKIDGQSLCEKITELKNNYKIPESRIAYDADGIGNYLRGFFPGAIAIHNGIGAGLPEYFNLKSRLYFEICDMVRKNGIYIEKKLIPEIKERFVKELQTIKQSNDAGEKLAVLKKSEIKKLLGFSPDIADAFAYRQILEIIYPNNN